MRLSSLDRAATLVALLALASTVIAGSGIPIGQPDTEHSNYGDMGKAKEYVWRRLRVVTELRLWLSTIPL